MVTTRWTWIVNLGIFICILMLIAASVVAVHIIADIDESIAEAVRLLNGMGLRRFLSMKSATDAKELLMLNSGMDGFGGKQEALKTSLTARGDLFNNLYNLVIEEEMIDGPYKDINYDQERTWHVYMDGHWSETRIGVIEMLNKMSKLCYAAANDGRMEDLLMIYRNGPSDCVYSFNKTIDLYVDL
jgi:hypothetical protein